MKSLLGLITAVALVLALAPEGRAWEAVTTHAGLTERAAFHSHLHNRLRDQLGWERGLFTGLVIPPDDAPPLFEVLATLNPTHGYVPDRRGRLGALGWLKAGAVVADIPPSHAANHFYDPESKRGLSDDILGTLGDRLRHEIQTRRAKEAIPRRGMAAPEWVQHADNPMNLAGFLDQYGKAVATATPAERERHTAGALLAAGAILHVLQDMGSPSHVRNDLAAHLEVVGNDQLDVGSRFERIAALAYGRLGIPAPTRIVSAASLAAFFTASDRSGLADRTAELWFSAHTLPRPIRIRPGSGSSAIGRLLAASLVRSHPAPLPRLDLEEARTTSGARLVDGDEVCLANYHMRDGVLSWSMDDRCLAEQAAAILPEVVAYSAGLLDWLFRGSIEIAPGKDKALRASAAGADFGAGTVELYWDDGRGVRTKYGDALTIEAAAASQVLATLPKPPKAARAVAVLFRGVDQGGQPLVAAGYAKLKRARTRR